MVEQAKTGEVQSHKKYEVDPYTKAEADTQKKMYDKLNPIEHHMMIPISEYQAHACMRQLAQGFHYLDHEWSPE